MLSIPLQKIQIFFLITLPFAWLVRVTFFMRRRSEELYSTVDAMAFVQIIIVTLTALLILTARPLAFWADLKGTSGRWWIFIYILGAVSFSWSLNPYFSLYRAFEYLMLAIALMLFILNSDDEKAAEKNMLFISWIALSCEYLAQLLSQGFSLTSIQSNSFGASAAMIACYSWGEAFSRRDSSNKYLFVSGFLSSFFVLHSLSIGSWWALLIGFSSIAIFVRRKKLLLIFIPLIIATYINMDQESINQFLYRYKAGQTFEKALHGRVYLWSDYWEAFKISPWLGYGFAMAARAVGEIYATNTHNFIFGVATGLGIIGLIILMLFLLKLLFELFLNLRCASFASVGIFAALIAGLINNMSLSFIGENWGGPSYVFTALLALHLYIYIARENPLFYDTPSNNVAASQ